MLRPVSIAAVDLPIATAPLLGYERRFYVSLKPSYDLGTFSLITTNSGSWAPNAAEALAIASTPMEIACVLDTAVNSAANIVVTITGTDSNNAALSSKVATFSAPTYSNQSRAVFARGFGAEPVVSDGVLWKTVTGISVTCNADAAGTDIKLLAIPSLTDFTLLAGRTEVDYTPKTDQPAAIQIGRDMGRYIKPGEIPLGRMSFSLKNLNQSDGLARFAGQRVTACIRDFKLDRINTMNLFLKGCILNGNERAPEGAEAATISAEGMFEQSVALLAAAS